jgi:hypothetical protein
MGNDAPAAGPDASTANSEIVPYPFATSGTICDTAIMRATTVVEPHQWRRFIRQLRGEAPPPSDYRSTKTKLR